MKHLHLALAVSTGLALTACAPKIKYHDRLKDQPPKTILLLPPENTTSNTEVEEKIYPILSTELGKRGYYVMSPEMIRAIFNANKIESSSQINQIPHQKLNEVFGCGALVRTQVTEWSSKYYVISATVNVGLKVVMEDCKDGLVLFQDSLMLSKSPGGDNQHPIAALINAAVHAASTPYEPIAEEASAQMFRQIPAGPGAQKYGEVK